MLTLLAVALPCLLIGYFVGLKDGRLDEALRKRTRRGAR